MRTIKLIDLRLRNFRKITGALPFNGESVTIEGENETGKSTYTDGYFWLLTGKDQHGQSKFDIKTRDANWNEISGLEHEVAGIFDVDGERVELKKSYLEIWERPRGKANAVFTGHTTYFCVDGEGLSEKLYKEKVGEIVGDPVGFSLVTNPSYLAEMTLGSDWTKARDILMKTFSTLTEADVLDGSPKLAELKGLVGKKTVASFKAMVADKQGKVNEEKNKIPTRIDEQTRNMSDVSGVDVKVERGAVARLEREIGEVSLRLAGINNGSGIADLSKRLADINNDIQAIELAHYNAVWKDIARVSRQIEEITGKKEATERRAKSAKADIEGKERRLADVLKHIERLKEEWYSVDAEEFTGSVVDTCPACRQSLPPHRVQEAIEAAEKEHNRKKAICLTDIETNGKGFAAERDRLKVEIEALQKSIPWQPQDEERTIEGLRDQRDTMMAAAETYDQVDGWMLKREQKAIIEAGIKAEREGVTPDIEKLAAEQVALEIEKTAVEDKIRLFEDDAKARIRIEQLKKDEKVLAAQYEELERQKFLCETFTRLQAEMLSTEINQYFKLVKWQLFETQVNGGIKEVCLATVREGTYGRGLNDGNKINAGLDICQAFSRATGLNAPIFIDRGETVTSDFESGMQVIKFVAVKGVKALTMKTTERNRDRKAAGGRLL